MHMPCRGAVQRLRTTPPPRRRGPPRQPRRHRHRPPRPGRWHRRRARQSRAVTALWRHRPPSPQRIRGATIPPARVPARTLRPRARPRRGRDPPARVLAQPPWWDAAPRPARAHGHGHGRGRPAPHQAPPPPPPWGPCRARPQPKHHGRDHVAASTVALYHAWDPYGYHLNTHRSRAKPPGLRAVAPPCTPCRMHPRSRTLRVTRRNAPLHPPRGDAALARKP
jgi:hypothetical protein